MKKLYFGTAGIPISTPKSGTVNGVKHVRKLGLDAMEIEFVRSVNIRKEAASEIKKVALKNKVNLTCHAPYYVNLSSLEKRKIGESKTRIVNSAQIAWLCGAKSVTFHAGFYMKQDAKKVFQMIKDGIEDVVDVLKDEGNNIFVRPETTGKASQFGDVDELIKLSEEVENVLPCVDFSHLHARVGDGSMNSYDEFCSVLEKIENKLGREALNNMHIHVSGIAYTAKGERHHLTLKESDLKYKELMKAFKDFKIKGIVISESPNIEKDALLMKKTYEVVK